MAGEISSLAVWGSGSPIGGKTRWLTHAAATSSDHKRRHERSERVGPMYVMERGSRVVHRGAKLRSSPPYRKHGWNATGTFGLATTRALNYSPSPCSSLVSRTCATRRRLWLRM